MVFCHSWTLFQRTDQQVDSTLSLEKRLHPSPPLETGLHPLLPWRQDSIPSSLGDRTPSPASLGDRTPPPPPLETGLHPFTLYVCIVLSCVFYVPTRSLYLDVVSGLYTKSGLNVCVFESMSQGLQSTAMQTIFTPDAGLPPPDADPLHTPCFCWATSTCC